MNFTQLRAYLLSKTGAVERAPFDPHTLVYAVGDQVFGLISCQATPPHLTLRCRPERAEMLRSMYPAVRPGVHMNRRHWNTVSLDDTLSPAELRTMVDASYRLALAAGGAPDRLPAVFEEGVL